MYIGRFVIVGKTLEGTGYIGYRLSSRSYPNRRIVAQADRAMVLPTEVVPKTDNPYISYNCLRRQESTLVVANGSHVDPIIEKVKLGYGLRDALALALLALDYEKDQYNTPRVAAGLDTASGEAYLGIIGTDKLAVQRAAPGPGEALLIATYECTAPTPITLSGDAPEALCNALYTCAYEHPVAALVAMFVGSELRLAARSAR